MTDEEARELDRRVVAALLRFADLMWEPTRQDWEVTDGRRSWPRSGYATGIERAWSLVDILVERGYAVSVQTFPRAGEPAEIEVAVHDDLTRWLSCGETAAAAIASCFAGIAESLAADGLPFRARTRDMAGGPLPDEVEHRV